MKILILGGGQDGLIMSFLLSKKFNIKNKLIVRSKNKFATYYTEIIENGSFLKNFESLKKIILKESPTHIINTVALSSSKECNDKKEEAFQINSYFVEKLCKFVGENNFVLIHFGSILEKQNRPDCVYTQSKILASNFIKNAKNKRIKSLFLPNHESPLRDKRFFIRELINKFQKISINSGDDKDLKIFLLNGTVIREWSWAPNLMDIIINMIIEDKYHNNFNDIICKASLLQFTSVVGFVLKVNYLKIDCNYSGTYTLNDINFPRENTKMNQWIKLLFTINYEARYKLNNWCFVI